MDITTLKILSYQHFQDKNWIYYYWNLKENSNTYTYYQYYTTPNDSYLRKISSTTDNVQIINKTSSHVWYLDHLSLNQKPKSYLQIDDTIFQWSDILDVDWTSYTLLSWAMFAYDNNHFYFTNHTHLLPFIPIPWVDRETFKVLGTWKDLWWPHYAQDKNWVYMYQSSALWHNDSSTTLLRTENTVWNFDPKTYEESQEDNSIVGYDISYNDFTDSSFESWSEWLCSYAFQSRVEYLGNSTKTEYERYNNSIYDLVYIGDQDIVYWVSSVLCRIDTISYDFYQWLKLIPTSSLNNENTSTKWYFTDWKNIYFWFNIITPIDSNSFKIIDNVWYNYLFWSLYSKDNQSLFHKETPVKWVDLETFKPISGIWWIDWKDKDNWFYKWKVVSP